MKYKKLLAVNIVYFFGATLVLFYLIHFAWLKDLDWLLHLVMAMNLAAFTLMGVDKYLARRNTPRYPGGSRGERGRGALARVPELFFYLISILGGSSGVLAGALIFRHKTQKLRFIAILALIFLMQILAVAFLRRS